MTIFAPARIYVWADGERKHLAHVGQDGETPYLQIELDLNVCETCCAVVDSQVGHRIWHMQQEGDDE